MSSPAPNLRAPLLWLLCPLMTGLVVARIWPPPAAGLWPVIGACLVAGLSAFFAAWFDRSKLWMACLALSVALSGYALLHARYPGLYRLDSRPPRELTVTVEVWRVFPTSPAARNLTGLATITDTGEDNRDLVGRRVYFSAIRRISVSPQRSGRYMIKGVMESLSPAEASGGFNDYLVNLGVTHRLTRAHLMSEVASPGRFQIFCRSARARLEFILQHGMTAHPDSLSLYLAMLLGDKAVLTADQENAFMRSGTFHIFSISGLHVGVIALALHTLCRIIRLPRRPAVIATLVTLWLYVQITGAGSPAVRAFMMIAFLLSSQVFRLPGNSLAALAASALITLLIEPLQLFSTGFQMSYSVVAALIIMGAPLAERCLIRWQPFALLPKSSWRWWHKCLDSAGRKLIAATAGCWAAFLASTPSGIGFFGLFSPGSLLANLVIIPLSSCAIISGFVSLLTGLAGLLPLSLVFNLLAVHIISTTGWLLRQGTGLPGVFYQARFRAEMLTPLTLVLLLAVMLAGASGGWSRRYGGFWPPLITLSLVIIFGVKFG